MFSIAAIALLSLAVSAQAQVTPQTNFNPVTITVNSAPYDVIAVPITPVAPYSQAAFQCNVTGDSRYPAYASGTFPLNVNVPVGQRVRVIFANGNLNGATTTMTGEPGVIVQQGGSPIVQQAGGASPIVQKPSSPVVQPKNMPPAAMVVQQGPTVVQQQPAFQPAPTVPAGPVVQQSPINQGASPINQGASPINQGASPINQGASPINQGATPSTPAATPAATPASTPAATPASPINQGATPASPINQGATPASPINQGATPASPINQGATPASPINQGATPASPINQGATPATPASPINQGATPATPASPASPINQGATPPTTPASPINQGRKMLQDTVPGGPNNGLVEYVALVSANTVPGFYAGSTQFGVPYVEFTATEAARGQTASFKGALESAQVVGGVPLYPFRPNPAQSPECQVNVNFKVV